MNIKKIVNIIKNFINQSAIIDIILDCFSNIFILAVLGFMVFFIWNIVKEGAYEYALNTYSYKVKIIIRDDALFIYFKPFWLYPKLINYGRVRDLGIKMDKKKAPKAYKNNIKYIYTVNMLDLMIYKEANLDKSSK